MHGMERAIENLERDEFYPLTLGADLHFVWESAIHRAVVRSWQDEPVALEANATHFLYSMDGRSFVDTSEGRFPINQGMYGTVLAGSVKSDLPLQATGPRGRGLIVSHFGTVGLFGIGGPIEPRGRLRYIDGCTDSLLIGPQLRGDPCLNHLHIPAGTNQTRHTHPSIRVGIIARGRGRCVLPDREYALEAGLAFVITPGAAHSFVTDNDSLDVVVYHPDSDTGPTHEDHPMINRTIIHESRVEAHADALQA